MVIACTCIVVVKNVCEQVSKNIFNKIGIGLVMSHTYNLSHAYFSHTHTVKHPTSVALLSATEWLDIHVETDSRQDAWSSPKVLALLYIVQLQCS